MSNQPKIFGRVRLYVDGQFYDSLPGASCTPGGVRKVSRAFTNSVKFSERYDPGLVSASIPLTSDINVPVLLSAGPVDLTFEGDHGKSYLIRNAVQTGAGAFTDGDSGGVLPVEFSGEPAEEITV